MPHQHMSSKHLVSTSHLNIPMIWNDLPDDVCSVISVSAGV